MSDLTEEQKPVAKLALEMGYWQHEIAAYYSINQGRISEFKNSVEFKKTVSAPGLPSDFPVRH